MKQGQLSDHSVKELVHDSKLCYFYPVQKREILHNTLCRRKTVTAGERERERERERDQTRWHTGQRAVARGAKQAPTARAAATAVPTNRQLETRT